MNRFFVATPLDFEQSVVEEMKVIWPFLLGKDTKVHSFPIPEVQVFEGGFEFEADLFVALQLNFFLKTANRVMLRMASFKARDLPKFFQKMQSLPWVEYLTDANVDFEVAAQKSRLNNEKRLEESARQALLQIFKNSVGPAPCGRIYIRMFEDLCTISLDTTGEHLHKRGWSVLKGEAPLRETLAAHLVKALISGSTQEERSSVTLLDPMMGAGTFLTEARTLLSGQFQRPYAFQKWKRAPKLFLSPNFALNYQLPPSNIFKKYMGFDLNSEMVPVAEKNFLEVERQLLITERKTFQKATYELLHKDAFAPGFASDEKLWMIVNPPYGERLPQEILGGVAGLAQALCRLYRPQRVGILYPAKSKVQKAPEGYNVLQELKINNGGIRCLFTVLTRL